MRSLVFAMLLLAAFAATAAPSGDPRPPMVSEIVDQQAQIRADVLAGKGRYKKMSPSKRTDLLSKQEDLLTMISGKTSVEELSESQRIKAFNTLEWIQAAINQEEAERLICRRERTIGSNRVTQVCRTEEEESRARENAVDLLRGGDPMGRGR